ncbi:unnamed protein product [Blepharisma stoltei]|uniref:Uncharacterized protein n=1 Tax=Blepharisma stoltei TaxID=1481888 RepID=A0AAU9K021_9CILI|nr:unnamed protein product [Blepharisma stoltei]
MEPSHSHSPSQGSPGNNELSLLINSLKEEQKSFEAEERYVEAQITARKIVELKQKLQRDQVAELKAKQNEERDMVDQAYQTEVAEFNSHWNKVIQDYLERCKDQEEKTLQKHQIQAKEERERLESITPTAYKPSAQLLNMIKCKERAVQTQKYMEANGLLKQIEELKSYEQMKHLEIRQVKIEQQMIILENRLQKEIENIKKRQKTGLDELSKQRNIEFDLIGKKYENIRREMENIQKIETNKKKGKHTTAAGRYEGSPIKPHIRSTVPTPIRSSLSPGKRSS